MKKLFIVAGEASGDTRAAEVLHELKKINSEISYIGLGSEKMKAEGTEIIYDLPSVAVIGLSSVIKKYPFFRKLFFQTLDRIKQEKPDAVLLVDYPGFNLRLANKLKQAGIPVIYYVSPQVWAWADWRVKKIARIIDKLLVILPFEVDIYKDTGLDVEFTGHPLVDKYKPDSSREELRRDYHVNENQKLVSILSGSRKSEVERILPELAKAAEKLQKDCPETRLIISKAPHVEQDLYESILKDYSFDYTLKTTSIHNLIEAADFCWVTSGTATLETTVGATPYILIYKTSWLTYTLAKALITISFIGLANIIAGRRIVPELIQHEAKAEIIAKKTKDILKSPEKIKRIKADLLDVKKRLGKPNAAKRAAEAVYQFLQNP